MQKLFLKLDCLPLVRLLQAGAIIILIVGLCNIGSIWFQALDGAFEPTVDSMMNAATFSIMILPRILFEPLVLLALAEIIKGQTRQSNLND